MSGHLIFISSLIPQQLHFLPMHNCSPYRQTSSPSLNGSPLLSLWGKYRVLWDDEHQHFPETGAHTSQDQARLIPCKPSQWGVAALNPPETQPRPQQVSVGPTQTGCVCLLGCLHSRDLCRMLSRAWVLLMMITIMIITSTTTAVIPRGPQADPCKSKTRSLLWWVDKSGLKQAAATQHGKQQGGGLATPGKLLLQWSKHMPWVLQITVKCSWFINCWLLPFHFFQSCNHF